MATAAKKRKTAKKKTAKKPAMAAEVMATAAEEATGRDILYVTCEARDVGELHRDADGNWTFRYAGEWLDEGFVISLSLPLAETAYGLEAERFFSNLLPEGLIRQHIARRLGISEDNDWELLAALGGDCAGALAVRRSPGEEKADYRELPLDELHELAASPHPGLAQIAGGQLRLSLAGAQDKLPVRATETGAYSLPLGAAASTHIIKFAGRDFAHLTANEVLVTDIGGRLDLPVVNARLDARFDPPLCVVERYDRAVDADGTVRRIHQEDVCQALGLPYTRKYEVEGGPDIGAVNALIQAHSPDPIGDTRSLIRWLIFAVLAGNADAHAKNLSLLHDGAAPRLAPFYDLLSTCVYPGLSRKLALSVAGRSDPGQIGHADWIRLGELLDVRPTYVIELAAEMTEALPVVVEESVAAFRETHGDLPVLQMVPPVLLRQTRCTRSLLSPKKS